MSKEKFTPGPWKFDDLEMKIKGTGDTEGRTIIANVSPKIDFARGMTTQCANAALIAAAPTMYQLLDSIQNDFSGHMLISDRAAWMKKRFEQIENILAAARGEQPETIKTTTA